MNQKKISLLILYLSFVLVIFYPFKGIASFILSSLSGGNVGVFFIPALFVFVFSFAFLNVAVNRLAAFSWADTILCSAGFIAFVISAYQGDRTLFYNTFLLFFLPVLFSPFQKVEDSFFYRTVFVFFLVSSIYLLIENIILHPWRFGLDFNAPSFEALGSYTNYLVSTPQDGGFNSNLIDYRHLGISNRTGGYLGNVLAMPVLISMSATFFYVSVRERFRLISLIFSIISVFLLISSISTTAIIAFCLTITFYEFFYKKKSISFLLIFPFIGLGVFLLSKNSMISYIVSRLLFNLKDPQYVSTFFWSYFVLFKPENVLYLIFGKWSWLPFEGGSSHIDLISIVVAYGGIIAYLLYRRMLFPVTSLRHSVNMHGRVFSMTVLTAVICLFHSTMTLNINVMLLVTLLYLKSWDIRQHTRDYKSTL